MSQRKNAAPQPPPANQPRALQAHNARPNRQGLVQPKLAPPTQTRPAAPPAYRPQPTSKVLQTKAAIVQPPQASQPQRRPVAPAAYRPQAQVTAQPKIGPPAQVASTRHGTARATVLQRFKSNVVQLKGCKICGANSHNTNSCPKGEKTEVEEKKKGRGLTQGGKKEREKLLHLIQNLDKDSMYGTGAKSLIGGYKGKPSGLDDKSARIDRQGEGNLQFQCGGESYACVTFPQDAKPGAVTGGLVDSFDTGEIVNL
jgi:hypothetical protein